MKSVVFALYFLTTAVSNAIALALAPVSIDPFVIYNYGKSLIISRLRQMIMSFGVGCAGASFIGGVLFYCLFKDYDKAEDHINGRPNRLSLSMINRSSMTFISPTLAAIGQSEERRHAA